MDPKNHISPHVYTRYLVLILSMLPRNSLLRTAELSSIRESGMPLRRKNKKHEHAHAYAHAHTHTFTHTRIADEEGGHCVSLRGAGYGRRSGGGGGRIGGWRGTGTAVREKTHMNRPTKIHLGIYLATFPSFFPSPLFFRAQCVLVVFTRILLFFK